MTRVLVLGDTHGDTQWTMKAVGWAKEAGAKKIMQVGDFGLWTHMKEGISFLDQVNEACRREGVKIYAVGGNHEHWDHWDWFVANMPKSHDGFARVRSHILLAPRKHNWTWEGKIFLGVGGAVSVDKKFRQEGLSWWPNEAITDELVASIPEKKIDYFISHDCSNRTPFRGRLKPDLDSQANRYRIDTILRRVRPEMHFHGHMHTKYEWENMVADDSWTKTYGLDMNGTWDSWGILEVESGRFAYRGVFD